MRLICHLFFDLRSSTSAEVQSVAAEHDDVEKISSMLKAVPLLDEAAKTYMSHRMSAKVHFRAIEQI